MYDAACDAGAYKGATSSEQVSCGSCESVDMRGTLIASRGEIEKESAGGLETDG